ncbi:MAG TPA: lmo0937 family membrane protein [Bacteroidia bacterium]|jgi:hypothetical protein|nr:lmo0937 family membrane protein [Bacteroidia bacterium]
MKKFISFITICIGAGILFSSCNSNMSMVKRHYTNGYYIAHSEHMKKTESSYTLEENLGKKHKRPLCSVQTCTECTENVAYPFVSIVENGSVITSNNVIKGRPPVSKKLQITLNKKGKMNVRKISDNNTNITEPKKISGDAVNDGLSLFWIIILIILILWAIGFISGGFGLGGLINLLLIVALILLILWLLRIL